MTHKRKPYRVLVFGDDTRSFLTVVRSLGRRGIEVHAVPFAPTAPALRSRYVAQVHCLPAYDGSDAWFSGLSELLAIWRFDLLIPCCDRSILCLDAYRHRLGHQAMALPDRQAIEALFDKHETRRIAHTLGVKVARGRLLRAADKATTLLKEFRLPVFIKARHSYVLDNLVQRGEVKVARAPERLEELLAAIPNRGDFLIEAGIDGVGRGVSLIAEKGEVLCAFQHLRLQEPGDGGGSSFRQSEALDGELLGHCKAIVRHVGYTGVAMFEFRVDPESGQWVLLEVNARFWGSLPLPVGLGVDFPAYLFDLYVHGRRCAQVDYPAGRKARNLAIYIRDVLFRDYPFSPASMVAMAGEVLALGLLPLRLMAGRERSDTFQADDWRPAALELLQLPKLALRMLARRWFGPLDRSARGHKI